jgi:transketolase
MNSIELAAKIRLDAVVMTNRGNSSHIASVLSIADILAVLYAGGLQVDPKNPIWPERDRFILSKGHAGAGVYAALAETGFFSAEKLLTHYQNGSTLSGHISHKGNPGVEFSTGSLGHGLSVATGMALALKRKKINSRVFCLMSDGECDEGSIWEAAMFASHHKVSNLVAIIDYNKIQSLDSVSNTLGLEPLTDKWKSFGWKVVEVDGHDHLQLSQAISVTTSLQDLPLVLIAHTTKGKGVTFMENSVLWHYRAPQNEEFKSAVAELSGEK